MQVALIDYTKDAKDLLIFAKHTRRMDSISSYDEIKAMNDEEKEKELSYIFKTISGPWEFLNYTFFIGEVTRAFTHQLVRHRVGVSFAQQSLRIAEKSDFHYLATGKAKDDAIYHAEMFRIQGAYDQLLENGVDIQDARGILPTNILTSIMMNINLRSLNSMMNVRLCVRSQGEFQNVAKEIRRLVLEVHPWAESALLPFCMEWGVCKFQNFQNCPIKKKHSWLQIDQEKLELAKDDWGMVLGFSPQPE